MDDSYEVIVFEETIEQFYEDQTSSALHFRGLTWNRAVVLCRLSSQAGFRCLIWKEEAGHEK